MQLVHTYAASSYCSGMSVKGQDSVVVEQIPLSLELYNSRMNGEAVFCHTGQFALRCPRTLHVGSGGIRYILATLSEGCIRKVIQVSAFMKSGTFYVSGQVYHLDIAVDFGKVRLQLGKETSSVSPRKPGLPILIY